MKVKSQGIICWLMSAVICLVATTGSKACPHRCTCYIPTEVHCTFRYLTSIPSGILPSVERINLGYNSLVRLTEKDFSGLNKLELLMLHSNGIPTIPDKVFSDLQALQVLKMSYNKVRKLQKDTFYGLKRLTRLHMDHNNIEFINPEVFYGLTFLRLVHLEGNQLTKLHPDTFVSLRYLQIFKTSFIKYLYLSDNFLNSLPQEMVSYMPNLESLYLHGNPWTCDCHLKWLSDWILEKPDVIKCKRDRSPSSIQQCPLCMNPRASKGKPFAMVPSEAFLCTKPTIDPSLKRKSLTILEDSGSASISPQDFMAPFGSVTLNMTDQSGNEANIVCSIQKPSRTSSIAFTEENDYLMLKMSLSTFLVCDIEYSHIQPVWQVLALYSDFPLILEKSHLISKMPQLCYKYKQVASKPEDVFSNVEADVRMEPSWLMQDQISLQLNRTATTLNTLHIHYSSDAQVTLPRTEMRPMKHKWTMISRDNNTKLERTVLVGQTIELDCPGQGDPTPQLKWLLADGSKVGAPYISEDGRILIDKSGKLQFQMADSFDAGLYHCISTNYDDADILTYRITVVEPAVGVQHKNGAHHTVFIGETLDLPCHSTGIPDASISWVLPGNTVLYQSSRNKQILNNGTLRILLVTPNDQGHYHCVAANPSGVDLLIFQVSVKMKGQRAVEHDAETDGSGLDAPNPVVHPKEPPATQLLTSAPMEVEVGKQVLGTNKTHNNRELIHGHGDSTHRHFREHRRQFLPSAQRIDPQHWAVLLEKMKKNAATEKQENTAGHPTSPVTQILKLLGEEESSGVLPASEEFMVLTMKDSNVPARTVITDSRAIPSSSAMEIVNSGTQVSPILSPQILPPEKPIDFNLDTIVTVTARPKNGNSIISTKDTTSQNSHTVSPLLSGSTKLHMDHMRRSGEHFQNVPSVTAGTTISNVNIKDFSNANSKADIFLMSVNPTSDHRTSETTIREPKSNHFSFDSTQKLLTSPPSTVPDSTASHQFHISRNSTSNIALSRRFGRWKKIWGRGKIIKQYRIPIIGPPRYSFVKPKFRGSSEESTTAYSATELSARCPSCYPTVRLTSATTLMFPHSSLVTLPQAGNATITFTESTTLHQHPSLLFNIKQLHTEKTTPTIKYFSAESIQVTATGAVRTHTPTSKHMDKINKINTGHPKVSRTHEMKSNSLIKSPHLDLISRPSMPCTTRFSRRKIPWNHSFVNNCIQKERLKNQYKLGSQKSIATPFPTFLPALFTDNISPFHLTTLSENVMQIPPVTLTTTHHNTTETQILSSLQKMKEQPFTLPHSTTGNIASKESHTTNFLSKHTATTSPIASTPVIINKIQTARPGVQKTQSQKEPQKTGNDFGISLRQSSGFATSTGVASAVLMTNEAATKSNVSALTHSPLEYPSSISSTIGFHSRSFNLADVMAELPRKSTQTLNSETTFSSNHYQSNVARGTITNYSTVPPFPNSHATLMPTPTHPLHQSAITDNIATPIVRKMANTTVKTSETSSHEANIHQLTAEVTTSPKVHLNAKFTIGTTCLIYSNELHSTPLPSVITAKPKTSKLTPSPWTEKQYWHKLYLEIARKGKKPVVSISPTPALPEDSTPTSNWYARKTEENSGFEKIQVKKTTSGFLTVDSLPSNTFEKPRIVGGKAASFTVPANSDAFLPCEAIGNPQPAIRWTRVSSGLDLSKRKENSRFQVFPNGTLSIQRVNIQDHGQYLCSASNPFGTDRLHVTLSVVAYPARILNRNTKELTVHSGTTIELKCKAEGRPSPVISWILPNQTVVSESLEGNRAFVKSDGTLVIHNLSAYDRGFYKCIASNLAGQDTLLVRIQVIAAPPVILEQKRQVLDGTWGEDLRLPCTADGTPQPRVHWVLTDGTEVKPLQLVNSRFFLFSNGTLYIRNVASSDRGTYECIATSSTGSERRVVILVVEERDTIPRIEVASQKWTEVNLGGQLLLNCSATGEPKPKIIWRLPSKAVIDQWHRMGSQIHVYPNGSLFIRSVTEKDGGNYLCVARNKIGDDLILMHVSLRLKPAKIDYKQHFRKQVLHGKDFQVDCKASGSPVPEISWRLPDGTVISNAMQADASSHRTRRYILFNNGTLYFNKVGVAEEGDYTCHAQNTLGKDEMKVHLTVITTAPQIRQGHRSYTRVKAGDTAALDCEVTGEPKPKIFWLLPSNDMISFSNDRYTFHANGSLSINKVKLLDAGEYVCVAQNPSGEDTKMYKLNVVSKPPLINGRYTDKTVIRATAVRHSKKHLECRAEGTPTPQITWIIPDNIFLTVPYYGGRITVHQNGTLEIRNVRPSDSADFTCVAQNEGGESVLVVQLEVLEMLRRPTFRDPFNEKIVALLGKPTALNCSVDGNPPPEIIWILPNGTSFSNGPQNCPHWIASNGSLIISKTSREDAGKYRCAARNKVGYIEKLIILEIGQKPVILSHALGTVKGISGESLWLHCVSDGIPKPHIKWTLPSGQIIQTVETTGKYLLYENGTLVIKEATAYNTGNYICKAQNSVGYVLITVPVMVAAYPPRITHRPPRSILTRTGATVQLPCVAFGVPKPEVIWEVPESSVPHHPKGTLVIQNPQTSDSGIYKCIAKNPLGSDYATTYIHVIRH
ncbi:immunoglobulin superfamily member 10 [Rhynchocyon petersi]